MIISLPSAHFNDPLCTMYTNWKTKSKLNTCLHVSPFPRVIKIRNIYIDLEDNVCRGE